MEEPRVSRRPSPCSAGQVWGPEGTLWLFPWNGVSPGRAPGPPVRCSVAPRLLTRTGDGREGGRDEAADPAQSIAPAPRLLLPEVAWGPAPGSLAVS